MLFSAYARRYNVDQIALQFICKTETYRHLYDRMDGSLSVSLPRRDDSSIHHALCPGTGARSISALATQLRASNGASSYQHPSPRRSASAAGRGPSSIAEGGYALIGCGLEPRGRSQDMSSDGGGGGVRGGRVRGQRRSEGVAVE